MAAKEVETEAQIQFVSLFLAGMRKNQKMQNMKRWKKTFEEEEVDYFGAILIWQQQKSRLGWATSSF